MIIGKNIETLLSTLRDGINKLVYGRQVVGQESLVISTESYSGGTIKLNPPTNATRAEITHFRVVASGTAITQDDIIRSTRYFFNVPQPNTAVVNISSASYALVVSSHIMTIVTSTPHGFSNGQVVRIQNITGTSGGQVNGCFGILVTNSTTFTYVTNAAVTGTPVTTTATAEVASTVNSSIGSISYTAGSAYLLPGGLLPDNYIQAGQKLIVDGKDNLNAIRFYSPLSYFRAIHVIYYS